MNVLVQAMLPELILAAVACVLFLLGVSSKAAARRVAPVLALVALLVVFGMEVAGERATNTTADAFGTFRVYHFGHYIKMLTAGVGALLVLLAWPTNRDATGNSALEYGADAGEFFALMLLSLAGVMLVAGANDIILLFLGIELASIPTYIMVSMSRPIPVAQEAGVKYFFLGAMSAAVMLFGFSYLYGTTGLTDLNAIMTRWSGVRTMNVPIELTPWQKLAVVMLVAGFAFKIAAVPLHFYAGDVYQGAATPVTAFLSFVPKTAGFVALIKLLHVVTGGPLRAAPPFMADLLWVMAVLTMTVGNVLGLLQFNVKRVLAYSSIAHSGYMLVGLAVMAGTVESSSMARRTALEGVLFYLAAYGIMNAAAFGVLMLLPARPAPFGGPRRPLPATSAETFEDLAGAGRSHVGLGLAMAVSCFSLIGLPLTVGFWGKLMLIRPALQTDQPMLTWLVVITMVNAAISAAYYLRIVGTMFLRPEPAESAYRGEAPAASSAEPVAPHARAPLPILLAIILSVTGTLLFGALVPATEVLMNTTSEAANVESTGPFQGVSETADEADVVPPATAAATTAPAAR